MGQLFSDFIQLDLRIRRSTVTLSHILDGAFFVAMHEIGGQQVYSLFVKISDVTALRVGKTQFWPFSPDHRVYPVFAVTGVTLEEEKLFDFLDNVKKDGSVDASVDPGMNTSDDIGINGHARIMAIGSMDGIEIPEALLKSPEFKKRFALFNLQTTDRILRKEPNSNCGEVAPLVDGECPDCSH